MTIKDIQKRMIEYRDLFGFNLLNVSDVEKSTTKEELSQIIDLHSTHIEMMSNDAQSSLERFRQSLGLNDF